jgi:hypothetical protein
MNQSVEAINILAPAGFDLPKILSEPQQDNHLDSVIADALNQLIVKAYFMIFME